MPTSLLDTAHTILNASPLVGIAAAGLVGTIAFHLKSIPNILSMIVRRLAVAQLIVQSDDDAYSWFERWLSGQPCAHKAKSLSLKTTEENFHGSPEYHWHLTLGGGLHWFKWNGKLYFFDRPEAPAPTNGGKAIRTIRIATFAMSQKPLRELVAEVHKCGTQSDTIPIKVWRNYWIAMPGRSPRNLSSLILPEAQVKRLLDDLAWFEQNRQWYAERGIPYRRGYLFAGPPGTGKTSIVLALAAHLKKTVCVLNLGTINSDDGLVDALLYAPRSAIILIEDIDCAGQATTRKAYASPGAPTQPAEDPVLGVSRAGLLNALDGVTTPEGRIVIMTTNYPERLDDALIRPGRADVHETFGLMGGKEQIRMAARFYDSEFQPLPFAVSPAQMQSACMRFPESPALARLALEAESKADDHSGAADCRHVAA